MILDIKTFPDEVLRKKNEPVAVVDDSVRKLLSDMVDTMRSAKGVGLAAPQVGVNKRVIVVDISAGEDSNSLMKIINPEILELSGEPDVNEEGCLSVPGEYEVVTRPSKAVVRYMREDGTETVVKSEGFLARALQHEIDHLNGVLFIDRLSVSKRETVKKRIRKRISIGDYVAGRG
ncbi:peptide deformylase [Geovibrio thiophilus]|uniref:Peptide deformylase n=1 Tax=Geovibrio thiophilus TaxID=139438 RepID=A0A3R5UZR6_9BACT|nr:peptide deformylase [Geovibrio thiophilus]QAR32241.1 peptide deformylase [Geovibrio thiophilus]